MKMGQLANRQPTESVAGLRPAARSDIAWVQARLREAIDQSPFYGSRFKAHEKARYSRTFLRALITVDPWHISLAQHHGAAAGFIVTIPDLGTLWSSWIYVLPEFRRTAVGLSMIRRSIAHWDNGRFHKASCYTKPDNHAARTIFRRYGFREVALLRRHVLGEDFLLMERELNKMAVEYDNGVGVGRWDRFRFRLKHALGV